MAAHPFLLVKDTEYQALRDRAADSRSSAMKADAINDVIVRLISHQILMPPK